MIPRPARPRIFLAAILALAAALRCYHLGAESLWLDECFALDAAFGHDHGALRLPRNVPVWPAPRYTDPAAAAQPWWRVPVSLRHDMHPPLPYLMLRATCAVLGYSDAAVRALSVAASLASIALLFVIARGLHGTGVALWACLLMAVAQPQIEYAQEAKHYALLTMWVLAACWAALRAESLGATRRRCGGVFLLALAALFTHYGAASVLAAIAAHAAWRARRGRDRWRVAGSIAAAFVVFAVLWGPVMVDQRRNLGRDADFLVEGGSAAAHALATVERAAAIPVRLLNEPPPGWDALAAAGGAALCLLPWLFLRRRPELLLWALWLPAVIVPPMLLDLRAGTWGLLLLRYTLLAGPAVYCLIAAAAWEVRRPRLLRHAMPAVAAASCLLALPVTYLSGKADWRTFGNYLAAHAAPGDAVVFATANDSRFRPAVYFLCTSRYAGPMPGPVFLLDRPADETVMRALRRYPHVWLVTDVTDPDAFLPGARFDDGRFFPVMPGAIIRVGVRPQTAR